MYLRKQTIMSSLTYLKIKKIESTTTVFQSLKQGFNTNPSNEIHLPTARQIYDRMSLAIETYQTLNSIIRRN